MPSSQQRRKPTVTKREIIDDLEPLPEKKPSRSTKEIPVSKVITDTLTDRLSATVSYAVSGSMLDTVGKEYAITPVEAYNIAYPTTRIIAFYLPGTVIKIGLPGEVADNVEKIIVTLLEYFTRISTGWVRAQFNRRLIKAGIKEEDKPSRNVPMRQEPAQPPVTRSVSDIDNMEDLLAPMELPPMVQQQNGQVPRSAGPLDYEVLKADGMVIGDTGQNY